jgi:hypothetical protein
MDPITLIAGATAAYNGLKAAISAGEDVVDTAQRLGNLMSHVTKVVHFASLPQKKGIFQSTSDFEAEAIRRFTAKKKAQTLAFEAKNLFISKYGMTAWDNIQKEVAEMRREAARQARIEAQEAEEARKDIFFVVSIVGGLIAALATIFILVALKGTH